MHQEGKYLTFSLVVNVFLSDYLKSHFRCMTHQYLCFIGYSLATVHGTVTAAVATIRCQLAEAPDVHTN